LESYKLGKNKEYVARIWRNMFRYVELVAVFVLHLESGNAQAVMKSMKEPNFLVRCIAVPLRRKYKHASSVRSFHATYILKKD
jgi:hypothetical protein